MINLAQLLTRASQSRVPNPLQHRAQQTLEELQAAASMRWQDVSISSHEQGWLLSVYSTLENGQVDILVPKDKHQEVAILQDTRGGSAAFEFETLFARGRYYEAANVAEQALRRADEEMAADDPRQLPLIANLAAVYMKLAKYHRAEILFEQALDIHRDSAQPEDIDWVRLLNDWALMYYYYRCNSEADFVETEARFQKALQSAEQILDPEHALLARILTGYARFRLAQFRPEVAAEMLDRAMNILETSLGSDHADSVETLLESARLRAFREEHDEAETMFRKGCELRELSLGPDHPDLAEALFALADHLYNIQQKNQEAADLLNRALDIWERTLGLAHPLVEQESRFIKNVLTDLQQDAEDDDSDDEEDEFADDVEF